MTTEVSPTRWSWVTPLMGFSGLGMLVLGAVATAPVFFSGQAPHGLAGAVMFLLGMVLLNNAAFLMFRDDMRRRIGALERRIGGAAPDAPEK